MYRFVHSVDKVIFLDGDDVRRAPMAAALFRRFAEKDPVLSSWKMLVLSAGSGKFTEEGAPAHPKAQEAMGSMGLDISSHKATTVTSSDIDEASIVLAIDSKHKKYADEKVCIYAGCRAKIISFFDYLGAADLTFDSLVGSRDLSKYLHFAKWIESFFPRIAYRFRQDTRFPLLARGHGFGATVVEGKATKLDAEPKPGIVTKGDVIVCNTNHVIDYFGRRVVEMTGAIVSDSHSEMSHLSEIAFELGIPCIGGTRYGTKAIDDGARVMVDGTRGLVYEQ